jgi:hypothetical protein
MRVAFRIAILLCAGNCVLLSAEIGVNPRGRRLARVGPLPRQLFAIRRRHGEIKRSSLIDP